MNDKALGPLSTHRGPYRFCLTRPPKGKAANGSTEWLKGVVDKDDVPSEALALLADPRDEIDWVGVWSVTEEQFVTSFRKES